MKRHIALLVCILLIVTMAFVACGKGDVDETTGETSGENINTHQHTFGDVWSMDETNHWHAATCTDGEDCTSAKVSVTAHTDADKNSVCDTCGYDYGHAHTYATELSSDETGHWYAVTCECSIDVKDKASHADANNDGTCDVCAYNGGHEHTYVTDAWATDADNHWHAASCGHSVIEDSEAHDFDDMGLCEVCGYLKGETIAVDKAVEMGEFYASLVNGGNIFFERDEWGSKTQESIDFVLGNGNANWSVKDLTYGGQTNYYYSLYKNTIFGVVESVNEDGSVNLEKAYEPSSALVNGYLFANVFGWDGAEEDAYYGTTNLVVGLYEAAKKSATLEECIIIADGKNVYTFSFTRPVIDWEGNASLYVISVSFTLSDEYTYETVSVSSAKYAAAADDETAENVTYHTTTLLPTTVYNYNVTQTVGERTQTPKYEAEKVLMTDFKLVDANGNEIKDTIKAEAGSYLSFTVVPVSPESANLALDSIECEADSIYPMYWGGELSFSVGGTGNYTLTVKSALVTKTYTVEVSPASVTEIWATVNDGGIFMDKDSHTAYVDADGAASVIFSAGVNAYANAGFTASLPAGETGATLTDNGDGTYTLNATSTGNWVVTLTSTENPAVSCTLDITVTTPSGSGDEDDDNGLDGVYNVDFYGTILYVLTFDNGSLTIEDNNNGVYNGTFTYTGTPEVGVTVFNADGTVSDIIISMDMGGNYTFQCGALMMAQPLVKVGGGSDEEGGLNGTYNVNWIMDGMYVLTFENGTLTVEDNNMGTYSGTYTYIGTPESGMTIFNADGTESDMIISMDLAGNYTFQCMGMMMAQPLVKVGGGSNDEEGGLNGTYNVNWVMNGMYVLTFDNGILTVEDNNMGTYSGTYTYAGTPESGMTIFNADGTESDMIISMDLGGNYTFQCAGMMMAQPLVKVDGGSEGGDADVNSAIQAVDWEYNYGEYQLYFFGEPYLYDGTIGNWGDYIDFTYEVDGNNIVITFIEAYEGALAGATLVYDSVSETIIATTATGEMVFTQVSGWW